MALYSLLETNIIEFVKSFDLIDSGRKQLLQEFADYISDKIKNNTSAELVFICTHNSRRSHFAQIWAQTAAEYYGVPNIICYSGGTEATAFNPRAVTAVEKAGFKVDKTDGSTNPVYLVYYSDDKEPIECFSKVYSDSYNPHADFAAVMTCSDADENCPVVFGAEARFPIRYEDPKEFDGTDLESAKYIERSEQIAVEMLYAFSLIQ